MATSTVISVKPLVAGDGPDPKRTAGQLINGESIFVDGLVFNLGKPINVQIGENPTADDYVFTVFPVLQPKNKKPMLDSKGNPAYIWTTSYSKSKTKYDVNGKEVPKDGTFDKLFLDTFVANASETILDAAEKVHEALKGRSLRVRRKPYQGIKLIGGNMRVATMSIVCLDIVD